MIYLLLGHNPGTIFFAILFAIGFSIASKNPLEAFTLALCGENFIMSILGILLMLISLIIAKCKKGDDNEI